MIAAVVLAAGRSTRMGRPKLTLEIAGRTMLHHVVDHVRQSRCDGIVLVVGEAADRVARDVRGPGVQIVINERYGEGMGTSIAAGISALPPECEAAIIVLGDQPRVTAAAIDALIDAYRTTGKPLVASRYGGGPGAPTLIGRALFDEARRLGGDTGGRRLIERHPDLVHEVPLSPDLAADLDTPEEFARVRALIEKESLPPSS
jgi:molybdenum cofactor cytidylyltransferase